MIVPVCVAAFGSRSTISGWAAISPSPKSSRFAHHRVHRRLDYPASLGLDPPVHELLSTARGIGAESGPDGSVPYGRLHPVRFRHCRTDVPHPTRATYARETPGFAELAGVG